MSETTTDPGPTRLRLLEATGVALARYGPRKFRTGLSEAMGGHSGRARLDRALSFIVEFQRRYPMRTLVATEPGFVLDQLERALRSMAPALVPLFEEQWPTNSAETAGPADLADLVVRTALSHFLIEGDDAQLLRELRHVVRPPG